MKHSGLTQVEKQADSSFANQSSGALKTSFPGRVTSNSHGASFPSL